MPPSAAAPLAGLDVYACPSCQGTLEAGPLTDGDGVLRCGRGHEFPVRGGMPRFVASEGYAASFGYQWKQYAVLQRDSHLGAPVSRDRLFRGTRWPEDLRGQTILEAGCGSGRFTEVLLSTGAKVVSFDYSAAAEVTFADFGDRATVCQASIFDMPYRRGSFDRVFCYGVIQHTPDVERAFRCLVEMVKPGGYLAVDVYDRARYWLNTRYRVRPLTKRLPRESLHRAIRWLVPRYMKVMPPLHPWNQLVVPLKDYRNLFPQIGRDNEIEMSILDTLDALSPEHDHPQYVRTMRRWCREAGLVDVEVGRGGNGIEVRARRPAAAAR